MKIVMIGVVIMIAIFIGAYVLVKK